MALMERAVLVLNAAYEPIQTASAKKAMILLVKGVAVYETEATPLRDIHPGWKLPSVIRLLHYRHVPHIKVLPHHRNIYLRDNYTCQYCGKEFTHRELTFDHVRPKVQGGLSTWENLVTCCKPCNHRKAGRTPEEANMPLLRRPRRSTMHTSKGMMRIQGRGDPHWRKFLYY